MARGSHKCPNCTAPLDLEVGQVEIFCEYCDTLLKFVPSEEELEVVRRRDEMKSSERLARHRAALRQQLDRENAEQWRQTAARVAIAALPVVGRATGRGLFHAALHRSGAGCGGVGCGCLTLLLGLLGLLFAL